MQSHEQYHKEFLLLPISEFYRRLDAGVKWKMKSQGLWDQSAIDKKDAIAEFKEKGLILTHEKAEMINGRK